MSIHSSEVVLVTGVDGGIGSALNMAFKASGYKVIGLGRRSKASAECDFYISCDLATLVSSEDGQLMLCDKVSQCLDEHKLSLRALINNAAYQVVKPLAELSTNDFYSSLQVNVTAPFLLAKLFSQRLKETKGTIVNIGSIHSRLTKPGFCAYSTSKAALAGLTRALALELAPEVTVNMVSPAATATEMLKDGFRENPEKLKHLEACHPLGRIADSMEVAKAVLFLCSQDSAFMTGSDISIDGGIGGRLHDPV
jgi:NAD(P)-dependent dehydrogenase (short-subunit alcohol dehydrogenase family)